MNIFRETLIKFCIIGSNQRLLNNIHIPARAAPYGRPACPVRKTEKTPASFWAMSGFLFMLMFKFSMNDPQSKNTPSGFEGAQITFP